MKQYIELKQQILLGQLDKNKNRKVYVTGVVSLYNLVFFSFFWMVFGVGNPCQQIRHLYNVLNNDNDNKSNRQ